MIIRSQSFRRPNMAGLNKHTPAPTEIKLHQKSRLLEIAFSDSKSFKLSHEMLRVFSPSAEVRGHGPGQEVLQTGKSGVDILNIEPVGNYAIKLSFSDGHDTGLYSWDLLYDLGENQDELWQDYLSRLDAAGASRDADSGASSTPSLSKKGGSCGHH